MLQSLPASLTAVFFESPNRIEKTLEIISKIFPKRRVCLAREITKLYEEFLIDFPKNLLAILAKNPAKICGEMVLLIEKTQKSPFSKEDSEENSDSDYENMVFALIEEIEKLKKEGFSAKFIAEEIFQNFQNLGQNIEISKKEIYRLAIQKNHLSK